MSGQRVFERRLEIASSVSLSRLYIYISIFRSDHFLPSRRAESIWFRISGLCSIWFLYEFHSSFATHPSTRALISRTRLSTFDHDTDSRTSAAILGLCESFIYNTVIWYINPCYTIFDRNQVSLLDDWYCEFAFSRENHTVSVWTWHQNPEKISPLSVSSRISDLRPWKLSVGYSETPMHSSPMRSRVRQISSDPRSYGSECATHRSQPMRTTPMDMARLSLWQDSPSPSSLSSPSYRSLHERSLVYEIPMLVYQNSGHSGYSLPSSSWSEDYFSVVSI